jgi:hypothetical protein
MNDRFVCLDKEWKAALINKKKLAIIAITYLYFYKFLEYL